MHSIPDDLAPALDAVPLFPLPMFTFFPNTKVPLHVFEPRYRAVVHHALATHRVIAMPMVLAGEEPGDAQPRIADVAGLGTIVEAMELPDGRFNIVLLGRARARLVELPLAGPFRRARAELLIDDDEAPAPSDVEALHAIVSSFLRAMRQASAEIDLVLPNDAEADHATCFAAQHLVLDPDARQAILETSSPRARLRLTIDAIALQHAALTARRGPVN